MVNRCIYMISSDWLFLHVSQLVDFGNRVLFVLPSHPAVDMWKCISISIKAFPYRAELVTKLCAGHFVVGDETYGTQLYC